MEKFSNNDLKALRMLLSYLHDKEESYSSNLTGRVFKGKFFVNQDEYHRLMRIEALVIGEILRRKGKEND